MCGSSFYTSGCIGHLFLDAIPAPSRKFAHAMSGHTADMSAEEIRAWFAAKREQRGWRPSEVDLDFLNEVLEMALVTDEDDPVARTHAEATPHVAASLVRPSAAFSKVTSAPVQPGQAFAVESYDALLRYAEGVASGFLPCKLLPQDISLGDEGVAVSADTVGVVPLQKWSELAPSNKHPRPHLVQGFLGEFDVPSLWQNAPYEQRVGASSSVGRELKLLLNLMSAMHDAACLCARVSQSSTANASTTRLLHGAMALLFHGLGMSERRTHELSALNAENASIRKAAYNTASKRVVQPGKQHAVPQDILTFHKQIGDDAVRSGSKCNGGG